MGLVRKVPVGLGSIGEVEQGLEVRGLLRVNRFEHLSAPVVLLQQALTNNFFYVCRG